MMYAVCRRIRPPASGGSGTSLPESEPGACYGSVHRVLSSESRAIIRWARSGSPTNGLAALSQDQKSEKKAVAAKSQLDGAWRLLSSKDSATGESHKLPDGIEMTKLVVGGRFVWTVVQDGKAVSVWREVHPRRRLVHRGRDVWRGRVRERHAGACRQDIQVHLEDRGREMASQGDDQARLRRPRN